MKGEVKGEDVKREENRKDEHKPVTTEDKHEQKEVKMKYQLCDIEDGEGIIIRREARTNRYVRLTLDEISTLLDVSNPDMTYHEIIENKAQKFYLDIDRIKDNPYEKLDKILDHVVCWFHNVYNIILTTNDIVVLSNTYEESISFHVIIDNYALVDAREAKWFYKRVVSLMSDDLRSSIDTLYKVNQSFRIEGSSKRGKHVYNIRPPYYLFRGKVVYQSQNLDYRSSLVSCTDHCILLDRMSPDVLFSKEDPVPCVDDIDLLYWYFDSYKMDLDSYRIKKTDNGIRLDRICPSYCALCDRVHESDNALFSITKEYIEYKCWRNDKPHKILRVKKKEEQKNVFASKLDRVVPE